MPRDRCESGRSQAFILSTSSVNCLEWPPRINRARVLFTKSAHGSVARYTCASGYHLNSEKVLWNNTYEMKNSFLRPCKQKWYNKEMTSSSGQPLSELSEYLTMFQDTIKCLYGEWTREGEPLACLESKFISSSLRFLYLGCHSEECSS